MQEKRVGSLSGGERNRVHLAKVMKNRNNVIFLDEPSNDLDGKWIEGSHGRQTLVPQQVCIMYNTPQYRL